MSVVGDTMQQLVPPPYGTIIGTINGAKVYSNENPPTNEEENYYPEGSNWKNGTYTGVRWQCVELARRYLLINYGVIFESVDDAVEIYSLRTVKNITNKDRLPLHIYPQGASTPPQIGSLVLWDRQGVYSPFGHVAVVVNVQDTYIDVAEQNIENTYWQSGAYYSRRIPVSYTPTSFVIKPYYNKPNASENVLGWATFNPRQYC